MIKNSHLKYLITNKYNKNTYVNQMKKIKLYTYVDFLIVTKLLQIVIFYILKPFKYNVYIL